MVLAPPRAGDPGDGASPAPSRPLPTVRADSRGQRPARPARCPTGRGLGEASIRASDEVRTAPSPRVRRNTCAHTLVPKPRAVAGANTPDPGDRGLGAATDGMLIACPRLPLQCGDNMTTTQSMKSTGLIRELRERWRSKLNQRKGERAMTDIVKRGDYPIGEWDPFRMMREMLRWDPFRGTAFLPPPERDAWMPHFEVRENGNSIRILADVPGVQRDDLEISITGNRLIVSG